MGVGEVGMNASACSALVQSVVWDEPALLASLALLAVIDVMVVLGNCLVIAAVFISSKLRSVTNLFIVSLAVADLLVGLAVLPFSATWEVFKVWIFGDLWCSVWLAVDVWMCTASILNLCAISLDRYVAVTRPVTYPSIMSMRRAKLLIAAVWILSFLICFPPLVGWKDTVVEAANNETVFGLEPPCPWRCELTNDAGYVIYSALGSFYIPMFVMLFFYWRIYRAAVQTTRAINRGFRTTKGSRSGIGNRFDEQRLTLRIHRGRGSVMRGSGPNSNSTTTTNSAANSVGNSPGGPAAVKSPEGRQSGRRNKRPQHERIKISVSYPSSDQIAAEVAEVKESEGGQPTSTASPKSSSVSSTGSGSLYAVQYAGAETPNSVFKKDGSCHLRVTGSGRLRRGPREGTASKENSANPGKDLSPSPTYEEPSDKPKLIARMGKRNIKAQVKRFRMETKAAKTLGIIVGGFIVCWLPFFTMYLVRAFCGDDCIHPTVFSVLFWLGYCNSAINPCIYALFSKDFRFAFKRIICRCLCSRRGGSSLRQRRGSDGSQLGGLRRSDRAHSSASACHNHPELHQNCHYNNNHAELHQNCHYDSNHAELNQNCHYDNNHHNHSDSDPNNEPGSDSR